MIGCHSNNPFWCENHIWVAAPYTCHYVIEIDLGGEEMDKQEVRRDLRELKEKHRTAGAPTRRLPSRIRVRTRSR